MRCRALHTLSLLCEFRALPIAGVQHAASLGLQRLSDKNANVRRAALGLFDKLLEFNPFCPSLNRKALEARRDAIREALPPLPTPADEPKPDTEAAADEAKEGDEAKDQPANDDKEEGDAKEGDAKEGDEAKEGDAKEGDEAKDQPANEDKPAPPVEDPAVRNSTSLHQPRSCVCSAPPSECGRCATSGWRSRCWSSPSHSRP